MPGLGAIRSHIGPGAAVHQHYAMIEIDEEKVIVAAPIGDIVND